MSANPHTQGERLVAAVNGVHGEHPGLRAAHARGICVKGTFSASPDLARLTRAEHLQGDPVPVTVRFSNGSGAPRPDYAMDGRGMAVKMHLPGGAAADMVALTLPVFFVRTPEDFIEFMEATVPDPATGQLDLARVGAFLGDHPETAAAFEVSLNQPNPETYARRAYNGIHTYFLVDGDGTRRPFRYRWEPDAGVAEISREEARAKGREYLQEELRDRLAREPVVFNLRVYLGGPDLPVDDPTQGWPEDTDSIDGGRLELTGMVDDQAAGCEALVFDPTNVVDGVECSDDPILHARSRAYSVSFARRRGLRSPGAAASDAAAEETAGLPGPGELQRLEVAGSAVALANVDGRLHAFADACTHRQCSLSEGRLDGNTVTCPCHGSMFDVVTGAVLRGPAREPVRVFAVDADGKVTAGE